MALYAILRVTGKANATDSATSNFYFLGAKALYSGTIDEATGITDVSNAVSQSTTVLTPVSELIKAGILDTVSIRIERQAPSGNTPGIYVTKVIKHATTKSDTVKAGLMGKTIPSTNPSLGAKKIVGITNPRDRFDK